MEVMSGSNNLVWVTDEDTPEERISIDIDYMSLKLDEMEQENYLLRKEVEKLKTNDNYLRGVIISIFEILNKDKKVELKL